MKIPKSSIKSLAEYWRFPWLSFLHNPAVTIPPVQVPASRSNIW